MQRRGISLVALVITIIVLIILTAGVIMLAGGENGIIGRAQRAVEANNQATATEKVLLEVSNIKMEVAGTGQTVSEYLYDTTVEGDTTKGAIRRAELEGKEITISATPPVGQELVFTVGDYLVTTDLNGNIKQTNIQHYLGDALYAYRYGDTINYGVNIDSTEGNTEEEQHIDGWKIFYEDSDYIYIIAGDYLANRELPNTNSELLNGLNMSTYTNWQYSAYWGSSSNFTSSDINVGKARQFGLSWLRSSPNNNAKATADLFHQAWTNKFGGGIDGLICTAIGGPTLEMYIKSWNAKGYTSLYCDNSSLTGYYVGNTTSPSTTYIDTSGDTGYNDTLYYPHQVGFNNCCGYWLASPSVRGTDAVLYVYCSGGVSGSIYYSNDIAVRPVVSLPKSDIQVSSSGAGVWTVNKK